MLLTCLNLFCRFAETNTIIMNKFKLTDLPITHIPSCLVTIKGELSQSEVTKNYVRLLGKSFIDTIIYADYSNLQYIGGWFIQVPIQDVKRIAPNAKFAFIKLNKAIPKITSHRKDYLSLVWW